MKFGIREICDVVLKAKAAQKIGDKVFYKNEPVLYFDSLKTSTLEGAGTAVYAQGGRGNARLISWDGDRTVTFTMEDALISPEGLAILTGAGLIKADANNSIKMHTTEITSDVVVAADGSKVDIYLSQKPYVKPDAKTDYIYVMVMRDGQIVSEPYIPIEPATDITQETNGSYQGKYKVTIMATETPASTSGGTTTAAQSSSSPERVNALDDTIDLGRNNMKAFDKDTENVVFVDYYVEREEDAFAIDISPDSFGGSFYLEASTLFRDTNGVDMPAEFVIPNCKIQSNFTFTMASTGDPSTFTFTMDAFPDYTRWDKTKKVLASIQVYNTSGSTADFKRLGTPHNTGDYAIAQDPVLSLYANRNAGNTILNT